MMISSPQRCICPSLQYRRYRSAVVPQCDTVSTVQTKYTVFGTSLSTSTGVEPRALPGAVQSLRQSRIQRALFPVGIIIIVASMVFLCRRLVVCVIRLISELYGLTGKIQRQD